VLCVAVCSGCGNAPEGQGGSTASAQNTVPCTGDFAGFGVEVCGEPITVVEVQASGVACHDAYLDCFTELCDRWLIVPQRAGQCDLAVTVDAAEYVLDIPLVPMMRPCHDGYYMYKPACGEESFYVGPECDLPICTAK